jgi:hypothetical protein
VKKWQLHDDVVFPMKEDKPLLESEIWDWIAKAQLSMVS